MPDTIKISHNYMSLPDVKDLERGGWQRHYAKNTGQLSWFYKEKKGGQYPCLSFFVAPDGKVFISVTVSLPSFIFGSNVSLPNQTEIEQGLDMLSEYVTRKSEFEFNARTANVWEVHFTKDYYVGEAAMQQVISKLREMNIPRFHTGGYGATTLYFHSKGMGKQKQKPRTICIYDKHQECVNKSFSKEDIEQAKGMLRLEFRYRTTSAVKRMVKALQLPNREAQTIFTPSVSDIILAPIEKQLLLLLEETDSQNQIIALTKIFGKRRAATLIQFLVNQYYFGSEFYKIDSLAFSRSAYYDCQKDCREIGITSLFDELKPTIQVGDVSW